MSLWTNENKDEQDEKEQQEEIKSGIWKEKAKDTRGLYEKDYGLFGAKALEEGDKLIINNLIFRFTLIFLTILYLALIYAYFSLSSERTTRIIMPNYGEFEVANMSADPLYYRVWGDYVLAKYANFTPQTIQGNLERATAIFEQQLYLTKKYEFDNYYTSIVTNNLTQTFRYLENDVSIATEATGRTTVEYKGIATQEISKIARVEKACSYKFSFYVDTGRIYQESVWTDCLNAETIQKVKEANTKETKSTVSPVIEPPRRDIEEIKNKVDFGKKANEILKTEAINVLQDQNTSKGQ